MFKLGFTLGIFIWCLLGYVGWGYERGFEDQYNTTSCSVVRKLFGLIINMFFGLVSLLLIIAIGHDNYGWKFW